MSTQTTSYIGARIKRPNAIPRLTGYEKYTDDVQLPGLLHVYLVTSNYAHAALTGIDTSAATSVPGVIQVVTAADLPTFARNDEAEDRTRFFLASERVSYVGQPIAAVVAETPEAAAQGADLVSVSYDPKPSVVHAREALEESAPIVRPERVESHPDQHPNLSGEVVYQRGDVEQAFRDADVIVERTFTTHSVHQGYMEPRSVTAAPDPTGTLTVWTATQGQFMVRSAIASALGLAETDVVIQPLTVGGGFGGRFMLLEPLAGLLAKLLNRPVQLTLTRSQDFAGTTPAPEKFLEVALAATRDGQITGIRGEMIFNTGYFSKTPYQLASLMVGSNYNVPNFRITSREVFTNRSGTGSYRAPSLPQMAFALEQVVDDVARKLDMSPIELRLRNAAGEGDLLADNKEIWQPFDMKAMLREIEQAPIWTSPKQPNEGVGIAIGGRRGATDAAEADVRLTGDGRLQVVVGSIDITGTTTGLTQITAEVFGIPPDRVTVTTAPSNVAPHSGGSGGSKILYTVGNAVIEATQDARQQVLDIASDELEVAVDDLEIREDRVTVRGSDEHFVTLKQIYESTIGPESKHRPVRGRGDQENPIKAAAMAAAAARVKVDPDTGEVNVTDFLLVQDVGRAINPSEVEGQMLGGVLQGVGIGLYEGLVYDDGGQLLTGTFMDYALPKASQAPRVKTRLIEDPAEHGPFGARGVAETPIVLPAAAIANAIFDATGVRLNELPMTPERVWRAMNNR
jgi:CO/xanthine dehydrogenase Mo-binding subunit